MVFQSFALYPWMTVMGNIEIVLKAAGLDNHQIEERVTSAIRTVGLRIRGGVSPRAIGRHEAAGRHGTGTVDAS